MLGPANSAPGAPFSAQVTVCNQGNLPGSTAVEVVLSADAVIDPSAGDRLVGGASVSLGPAQCQQLSIAASANAPGPNGKYFLGAAADLVDATLELNESNNRRAGSQLTIGLGADLTITSVKGPASALPGSSFVTTVTVCNQGNQPASAAVELLLSADSVISLGDRPSGSAPVSVVPGQCQTISFPGSANVPFNGAWFLGAIVDLPNAVSELDETNNAAAGKQLGIGFGPDFLITDVVGPASAGDRLVGGAFVSLAPGQCVVQTVGGPALPPGPGTAWFLGAIADGTSSVIELNESNNTHSTSRIGIGSAADLVITSLTGPSSVPFGGTFTVQLTLCNQGTTSSPARVDLVLSADAIFSVSSPPTPSGDRLVSGISLFLGPGQCTPLSLSAPGLPPGPPGSYFLGAIADVNQLVTELLETTNTSAALPVTFFSASGDAWQLQRFGKSVSFTSSPCIVVAGPARGMSASRMDWVKASRRSLPWKPSVGNSERSNSFMGPPFAGQRFARLLPSPRSTPPSRPGGRTPSRRARRSTTRAADSRDGVPADLRGPARRRDAGTRCRSRTRCR